jgi:hypothetical protein
MLIRLSDEKYPYTLYDLQQDYPNTSFPVDLKDFYLEDYNAAEVITAEPPTYNPETHRLFLASHPDLVNGVWVLGWVTEPLPTPPPTPNWISFNAALTTNAAKVSYDLALVTINPTLAGKLDLAYLMITTHGLDNFSQIFPLYCQLAGVTQAHRDEWADLAVNCDLPAEFVDIIRGV